MVQLRCQCTGGTDVTVPMDGCVMDGVNIGLQDQNFCMMTQHLIGNNVNCEVLPPNKTHFH